MKFPISFLPKRAGLILSIMLASVLGGLSTAVVLAAIPDSGGVIHGCYKNTGALRVIDSPTQTCNGNETALNWNQTGAGGSGGPILKDANDQTLGPIVQYDKNQGETVIFVSSLNRLVPIDNQGVVGHDTDLAFQSSDCTGQAYVIADYYPAAKTELVHVGTTLAIVADNATAQVLTVGSKRMFGGGAGLCSATSETLNVFPYTAVTVPFTTPVALPFKF